VHQHFHRTVPDRDAEAEGELGVHPLTAVGAVGVGVDPAYLLGQPGVPDCLR
jgi:hypothetical protein